MASRKNISPTRSERAFWREAFLRAELPVLLKHGTKITPAGLAHLSGEYADAAVREYQLRQGKLR